MNAYDEETLTAIGKASFAQLEQIAKATDKYDDTSNKLICLKHVKPGVPCSTVLSTYVAEQFLKAESFAELNEKRKFLQLFTGIPEMGSARGWVFEAYAHSRFASAGSPEGITFYTLTPNPLAKRKKKIKQKSNEPPTRPQLRNPRLNIPSDERRLRLSVTRRLP